MSGNNVLIFMADEHARAGLGCYGHPQLQTPNIDKLGAAGTLYANALNTEAFEAQALRIEELGGVDGIMALESFDFAPVEKL